MNEQELIRVLLDSAKTKQNFSSMTNEELAGLLISEIWADIDLFTPESDLLSAVIDRLRGDE